MSVTMLSPPLAADDFLLGGARPACDPTVSSCLPEPEKPECDVTVCFGTAEAQRDYEIQNNCVFPQAPPCTDSIDNLPVDVLRSIFSSNTIPDATINTIAEELNAVLQNEATTALINTKRKLAHFLSQVKQEVGPNMRLAESLNYSVAALQSTFSYFRNNPHEAELFGRTHEQPANQEAIANRAYANRIGNGDIASGDGWRYRGRGMIQLTGRANYETFTNVHNRLWPDDERNFIEHPDLLLDERYAVRSALVFWDTNNLHTLAERATDCEAVNTITRIVNRHTNSYSQRCSNMAEIMGISFFEECSLDD